MWSGKCCDTVGLPSANGLLASKGGTDNHTEAERTLKVANTEHNLETCDLGFMKI